MDVLLTHTPAMGCRDKEISGYRAGCPHLKSAIKVLQPPVHVFGHVHSDYGASAVSHDDRQGRGAAKLLQCSAAKHSGDDDDDDDYNDVSDEEEEGFSSGRPALAINAACISDYYLVGSRTPVVFDVYVESISSTPQKGS